jgi:hypothetical protein
MESLIRAPIASPMPLTSHVRCFKRLVGFHWLARSKEDKWWICEIFVDGLVLILLCRFPLPAEQVDFNAVLCHGPDNHISSCNDAPSFPSAGLFQAQVAHFVTLIVEPA